MELSFRVLQFLLLFEFFDLAFEVVHVDLHLMLQPNVSTDVGFELLDDLLVDQWGTSSFRAFLVIN